jgi:hypothetical protein
MSVLMGGGIFYPDRVRQNGKAAFLIGGIGGARCVASRHERGRRALARGILTASEWPFRILFRLARNEPAIKAFLGVYRVFQGVPK